VDDNDAELGAHRCGERDCIERRDIQPAELSRAGHDLEHHMTVRVIVVLSTIERERCRTVLGWSGGFEAMLVLVLVRQMRVHEPMRHREHGSRKASEQRSDEG